MTSQRTQQQPVAAEPEGPRPYGIARGHVYIDAHGSRYLGGGGPVYLTRRLAAELGLRGVVVLPSDFGITPEERRRAAEDLFRSLERERETAAGVGGFSEEHWLRVPRMRRLYALIDTILSRKE